MKRILFLTITLFAMSNSVQVRASDEESRAVRGDWRDPAYREALSRKAEDIQERARAKDGLGDTWDLCAAYTRERRNGGGRSHSPDFSDHVLAGGSLGEYLSHHAVAPSPVRSVAARQKKAAASAKEKDRSKGDWRDPVHREALLAAAKLVDELARTDSGLGDPWALVSEASRAKDLGYKSSYSEVRSAAASEKEKDRSKHADAVKVSEQKKSLEGEKVSLTGFESFLTLRRSERMGINPVTSIRDYLLLRDSERGLPHLIRSSHDIQEPESLRLSFDDYQKLCASQGLDTPAAPAAQQPPSRRSQSHNVFTESREAEWAAAVREEQIRFYVQKYRENPSDVPSKQSLLQREAIERLAKQ